METFYLISGLLVLLVTTFDFFYTTLSGSGASFLSRLFSSLAHKIPLLLNKLMGRKAFAFSGLLVNLTVLTAWALLFWLGLFLVFSYDPEAITNSRQQTATTVERLYFTGYVLSTLGMGNFKPVTPFFEVLTSLFSFFGFVFFTTSMTYLVSVFSALVNKRSLALAIRTNGKNPADFVKSWMRQDSSYCHQQISALEEMVNRHIVNHQAYPVLHYYNNPETESSLSINLAVLDEAMSLLLLGSKEAIMQEELQSLRNSVSLFLQHLEKRYGHQSESGKQLPHIDWHRLTLPESLQVQNPPDSELQSRRKTLHSLLKSEGFSWKDVYPEAARS